MSGGASGPWPAIPFTVAVKGLLARVRDRFAQFGRFAAVKRGESPIGAVNALHSRIHLKAGVNAPKPFRSGFPRTDPETGEHPP